MLTVAQLCKAFKVDQYCIEGVLGGFTYRDVPTKFRTNEEIIREMKLAVAAKMLRQNYEYKAVIAATGLSSNTVCGMRRKMDLPMTHTGDRTRITEDQLDEIIELHCNQGLSAAETGRRVGVAPSTVFKHTQAFAKVKAS